MTFHDYLHLLEWMTLWWLPSLVRMTLQDFMLHLLEWLCDFYLSWMTLFDNLLLLESLSMTNFTCYKDFVWLPSLVRMTLYDYLHLLEWLSTGLPSLVRMTFHDYLHLSEWLCVTSFSYWNDFVWIPSLLRMTLFDYLLLLEWLSMTNFTCYKWLCMTTFTC